jgi:stage V sporulation protein B
VLVPRQLERFGLNSQTALSLFGAIKGMALPLIFFPASFLNALSTLLIPEMSEASASGKSYKVRYTAEKCIHITLISALPFAVIFLFVGEDLGSLIYGDPSAGKTISLLAPIIPLMYLDSVCDGLLKGLDQQFSIFRTSLLDSLFRLALIWFFLPKLGFLGFIGIMYLSNLFTCGMNLFKLIKISKAQISWGKWLIFPTVFALFIGTILTLVLRPFPISGLIYIIIFSCCTAIFYAVAVLSTRCISVDDFR